ncbi:hypothetical protein ACQPXH_33100 (plasmid) [Nocardia sp. CA-135953]|uniref:hypothetical protein n=1 Tax=Nocardia sp. CA-135953 TaxID=3239978 RepID=UPI003D968C14
MPIRPENRDRYPADWAAISTAIKVERARGRCECTGECGRPVFPIYHLGDDGRCRNRHGGRAVGTGSRVVLTTAHLNHTPEDCRPENLKAMCQGCHLFYDAAHHAQTRSAARQAELAALMDPLFDIEKEVATWIAE